MSQDSVTDPIPELPVRLNMADYFLDARVREGKGDRVAVRVGDDSWTYRAVQARCDRLANALADRGIGRDDRVLFLLFDGIDFVT
ncbi:MAG: AMP-binding protein, partial [Sandaracinaceae bacterium]